MTLQPLSPHLLSEELWHAALRALRSGKAVPQGEPSIELWKDNISTAARELSKISIECLCSDSPTIPTEWSCVQLAWLAKPGKSPCTPKNLRSVGSRMSRRTLPDSSCRLCKQLRGRLGDAWCGRSLLGNSALVWPVLRIHEHGVSNQRVLQPSEIRDIEKTSAEAWQCMSRASTQRSMSRRLHDWSSMAKHVTAGTCHGAGEARSTQYASSNAGGLFPSSTPQIRMCHLQAEAAWDKTSSTIRGYLRSCHAVSSYVPGRSRHRLVLVRTRAFGWSRSSTPLSADSGTLDKKAPSSYSAWRFRKDFYLDSLRQEAEACSGMAFWTFATGCRRILQSCAREVPSSSSPCQHRRLRCKN